MTDARIGLNLLWMVPGVVGGSEEYTTRLLGAMAEQPMPDVQFVIFANSRLPAHYADLVDAYETVVAPIGGGHKALRVAAESSWLAREGRRQRLDLLHHLGGIMPFVRTVPGMVTIHDLQPLAMPEHFSHAKRYFSAFTIPRSARAARRVVTLTEYTRGDLVRRLGLDPDRIVVVPSGMSPPPPDEGDPARIAAVRSRYGLGDRPFFLYPAITYPHKNHLMLLEAFAGVARRHPEAALVLTGGRAQREDQVRQAIVDWGLSDVVIRPGRIDRHDLDSLYRTATALTFPSRFEGFGLPVLEAMARRCPVVAASETALPEVVADAGILLRADDPGAWTEAMARLLEQDQERTDLAIRGLEHSHRYDWPTAAAKLEDAYRTVLRESACRESDR